MFPSCSYDRNINLRLCTITSHGTHVDQYMQLFTTFPGLYPIVQKNFIDDKHGSRFLASRIYTNSPGLSVNVNYSKTKCGPDIAFLVDVGSVPNLQSRQNLTSFCCFLLSIHSELHSKIQDQRVIYNKSHKILCKESLQQERLCLAHTWSYCSSRSHNKVLENLYARGWKSTVVLVIYENI